MQRRPTLSASSYILYQHALHLGLTVLAFETKAFHNQKKLPWRVTTNLNFLVLIGGAELCMDTQFRYRIGNLII
jgi:hypothetical protein